MEDEISYLTREEILRLIEFGDAKEQPLIMEIKDRFDLAKITLPLSDSDYKKLLEAKICGLIKWEDFPTELRNGLREYDKKVNGSFWEIRKESEFD